MNLLVWFAIIAIAQLQCALCMLKTSKNSVNAQEIPGIDFDSQSEEYLLEDDKDVGSNVKNYQPNWASLDTRPLPGWYDKAKFGIFVHWGVFSVPGFSSEWFWHSWKTGKKDCVSYIEDNYPPNFTYQDFGREFRAEFYDPYKWAKVFSKAGAKYVVLVSKHHEGYTLWPSKYSFSWNSKAVGPGRDLVGELAGAIREKTNLRFGLYHSMYEWFNPLWEMDKANNFTTDEFVRLKTLPELYEIVNKYKPEIIWPDGEWEASDKYWQSEKFLAWLYNSSPVKDTVLTNDRWGDKTRCKHGGFYTCSDNFNPGVLQERKWENCMSVDKVSWGYRRNAQVEDYNTPEELIDSLVKTVSCGGNLLLNVGPTKEGTLDPLQEERLLQVGSWLDVNGEAIYESTPWKFQNDTVNPNVWYTQNTAKNNVYAITLKWPGQFLSLGSVKFDSVSNATILGSNSVLQWQKNRAGGTVIRFPGAQGIRSNWAWTVVLSLRN